MNKNLWIYFYGKERALNFQLTQAAYSTIVKALKYAKVNRQNEFIEFASLDGTIHHFCADDIESLCADDVHS